MEMNWTVEQQKVIDLRNRNILVSAAAGSGKTAVLVERIITMITEGAQPIDIDKLLVVTFTKAAAAEMKERVGMALEKKALEMPDNVHLQKQMTLIHSAHITTIHSFCQNVIRNYFHTIDLDPAFRVADEAELKLLKSGVIEEMLEECYEAGDENFLEFTEMYASGKTDQMIEELILQLYQFSMSYPWPDEWLLGRCTLFEIVSVEEMEEADWMHSLLNYIKMMLKDTESMVEDAVHICTEPGGPYTYLAALDSDRDMIKQLGKASSYREYHNLLNEISFARLSAKRDAAILEEKKNQVKAIRDTIKKTLSDLNKNYFFQSEEEMLKDIMGSKTAMNVLIDLTLKFANMYGKKKEEKNLVDFNDLEHFALNILVKREGQETEPTPAALDLSEEYEEILIDEYQDSNLVQETLLNAISREKFGRPNVFMVGDVKQSIYKFRLARPELFMKKYDEYSTEDSQYQRIALHQNFRSRGVVLAPINFIFEQIMGRGLGGIEYNEEAALHVGADYGEEEQVSLSSELILVSEEEALEDSAKETEYTGKELEARAIAHRIKELIHQDTGLMVKDKGGTRRARGQDIVILLRTMANWSEIFVDTLMAEGIPAYSDTQSGYFQTIEIQTILNLLRIIDNPRQDIPLTAILHSPIVGLDSNGLAKIRAYDKGLEIYDVMLKYAYEKELQGEEIQTKLLHLLFILEKYRKVVSYTPIHELIELIVEDTGYYNYVSAMPGGERRTANLEMLVQKAISFESTSYIGLFNFIRYIEKLHKYEVDFGEVSISGGNENSVRIMSIHKSKGLEFPIVFVAGMSKQFNNQDSRSRLVIHPDLGLGPDFVDYRLRIKSPTLIKKVMQKKLILENLSEELRVLYVALTRAKEKLIMTGTVKSLSDKLEKWNEVKSQQKTMLTFQKLTTAGNFLDWVVPALIRQSAFEAVLKEYNQFQDETNPLYHRAVPIEIRVIGIMEMTGEEVTKQIEREVYQEELLHFDTEEVFDQTIHEEIEKRLTYRYPYENSMKLPGKMTVSELKKLGQMEPVEIEETQRLEETSIVPKFLRGETEIKATDRGSIYHKVLERMSMERVSDRKDIDSEIERLVNSGIITKEESSLLWVDKIEHFIHSNLAGRMRAADKQGKLYKEQQFVFGLKANEINKDVVSDELVLVQGIIDVYFEEEGELVLMDYKTDRIPQGETEEFLVNRYGVQLDYYEKALEQMTGKKVKERLIYSFGMEKEIRL